MVEAFPIVNTSIEFRKFGTTNITGSDYPTEITEFTESATERIINYTKTIGGMILSKENTSISKDIEFKFVVTDVKFEKFLSDLETNSVEEWDTFDKYKITLSFTDGTDSLIRVYYNAIVTSLEISNDNDVLMGTIKFTLPMKNISGYPNFYVFTDLADKTKHDARMGYS